MLRPLLIAALLVTAAAADPAGHLLYSVEGADGRRVQWLHDLATGKRRALSSPAGASYVVLAASPSGRLLSLIDRKRPRAVIGRLDPAAGTLTTVRELSGLWHPTFASDTTAFAMRMNSDPEQLVTVDVASGKETTLIRVPGGLWDDVPLSLSPDGRWLAYYRRGQDKGIHAVDVKARTSRLLMAGGTIFSWAPDSRQFTTFIKQERVLRHCRIADDGTVSTVKTYPTWTVLGLWFGQRRVIGTLLPEVRRLQLALEQEAAPPSVLTSRITFGELLTLNLTLCGTERLAWVEHETGKNGRYRVVVAAADGTRRVVRGWQAARIEGVTWIR